MILRIIALAISLGEAATGGSKIAPPSTPAEKFANSLGQAIGTSLKNNQPCPRFGEFQEKYSKEMKLSLRDPQFKKDSRAVVLFHANPIYSGSPQGRRLNDIFKGSIQSQGITMARQAPAPGERRDLCALYRLSWSANEKLLWICDMKDSIYCHDAKVDAVVHSLPPELREDIILPSEGGRSPSSK